MARSITVQIAANDGSGKVRQVTLEKQDGGAFTVSDVLGKLLNGGDPNSFLVTRNHQKVASGDAIGDGDVFRATPNKQSMARR